MSHHGRNHLKGCIDFEKNNEKERMQNGWILETFRNPSQTPISTSARTSTVRFIFLLSMFTPLKKWGPSVVTCKNRNFLAVVKECVHFL